MAKKRKNFSGNHIASRDNTSVGSVGVNENITELQKVAPQMDVSSVGASFIPIVSDVMDVMDMKEAIENKDPLGLALASFGLLPFVGGIFTNANKVRKIKASYKDLLRLSQEPDVRNILKDQYQYTNLKSGLKELAKDEDKVDELYKRVLQGRYQFYRGDANISGHDITQIAPYNTVRVEGGIGAGRHNVEDVKDTGLGVLYTTNNPSEAAKFASIRKPGEGWVPTPEGGMGIIKIKDADFAGGRLDWLKNNPIPDESFGIRKIDNADGSSHYIFIGKPNEPVGKASYLPKEEVYKLANSKTRLIKDGTVAAWAEGGIVGEPEGDEWTSEDVGNPVYSKQSHRAVDQKARDEKFKSDLADQRQAGFEDVVVPAVEGVIDFTPVIGDIKSGYEMLMYTKEGNYAMASLSALGLFPGIPGAKTMGRLLSKPGERLVTKMKGHGLPYLKEVLNTAFTPKRFVDMVTWFDREGGIDQARKFSEMFPILPQDVIKANQKAEQAAVEGVNFVDSYYKDPKVKSRLQKLWGDNGYNMPEERLKILKEKGVIDEKGRVDVQKYMDLNPLEVGDTNALQHQDVLGFHQNIENGGRTVTYDRNYGYMRDPRRVASNAAHEYNHKMQEVFGIDNMSIYDEATGYYKANPDHTIGKMFQEVARKGQDDWWFNSPAELHSVVMEYKKVKGVAPDAEIDDKLLDKMLEIGMINKFFEVTADNKPKIKKLLNALPAVVPVAGAAVAGAARASNNDNVMDEGGVVGGADNYDIAFTHLTQERGLKPEQAVAIMANLDRESGLNPDITNSIGAYGIQQWLGPRKKELFKRYGEKPSLTQQLDFVLDEHQGKVKGMGWNFVNKGKNLGSDRFNYYMYSRSDFENAPSVADAIIAWNQGFGRPATHELNNEGRIKAGMQLAQRYGVDFGKNTYGQMGLIGSDVPDWIVKDSNTIQPESFREYVKQHNYTTQNEGSNGIASYVPEKDDVVKKIDIEDKEEDDEETAYAKRLRERDEMISKKKKEDMAKLAMFEKIWNSISLRRKSNP